MVRIMSTAVTSGTETSITPPRLRGNNLTRFSIITSRRVSFDRLEPSTEARAAKT